MGALLVKNISSCSLSTECLHVEKNATIMGDLIVNNDIKFNKIIPINETSTIGTCEKSL